MLTTLVLILLALFALVLVGVLVFRANSRERNHAERMWELRFPILDSGFDEFVSHEWFADLKEMLLVFRVTDERPGVEVRLHHLRRLDGPRWEFKEELDPWQRKFAELEEQEKNGFSTNLFGKEELEKLRAGPQWVTLKEESFGSKVEAAYQQFVSQYEDTFWPKTRVDLALDGLRRREARAKVAGVSEAAVPREEEVTRR